MYFDVVLEALRADQTEQCQVIYHTTMMGQLATENFDDVRNKYEKLAHDILENMKEREIDLEKMHKRAEDVWEYAKSLVRIKVRKNQ